MGRIMMSGVAPLMTGPGSFDPVFENNTWEQIINACKRKKIPENWAVGDQKSMTINGAEYVIDIIGKNHDQYSDGSGVAPLTFQMHDLYGTKYQMNTSRTNKGGWKDSYMRTVALPTLLLLMPTEVENAVREVSKISTVGSQLTDLETTSDKLFLLSEMELCGTTTKAGEGEGTQYEYYAAGNSIAKKLNGTNTNWWLRSPDCKQQAESFVYITNFGEDWKPYGTEAQSTSPGVSFAFCF